MLSHLHVPLKEPEDVKRHLAEEYHWKKGFSAQELVLAWWKSPGYFPPAVKALLESSLEYAKAELVDGFFERQVDLGSAGRYSQTDLMIIAGLVDELGVIAVEGKVDESFGKLISDWNDGSNGKTVRLRGLCSTLGLDITHCGHLRYQLLHRSASAIYEARRYRSTHALMIVHSFSKRNASFSDFSLFAEAMGIPVKATHVMSAAKSCEGVSTRLAWVSDEMQPALFPTGTKARPY